MPGRTPRPRSATGSQDEVGHAVRVTAGVLEREDGTPGVTEQRDRPFSDVGVAHVGEVLDLRCQRDVLGSHAVGGSSAPPLIVVDELEVVGEPVELGQEIRVVEVRSPVDHEDGESLPHDPGVELGAHAPGGDAAGTQRSSPSSTSNAESSSTRRRLACSIAFASERNASRFRTDASSGSSLARSSGPDTRK